MHPNLISRPCFLKSLSVSLAISLSAIDKKSSIASITVTCEPSLDQTLPNSNPITPAPITPRVFGTESISKAPVLSKIFLLSNFAEPISIGDDPVAIIIFLDSIISTSPLEFVTSTF